MKRALFALLVFFVVGSAFGQSPAKIRITIVNPSRVASIVGYLVRYAPTKTAKISIKEA
jgi:hypothetical protein